MGKFALWRWMDSCLIGISSGHVKNRWFTVPHALKLNPISLFPVLPQMVLCSTLKFLKLFYLSLATFQTSTTMVQDEHGNTIAYQNALRSTDGALHHKYTFIANASYSHCFKDPMEITWLYNSGQKGYKVISFSSSLDSPTKPAIRHRIPPQSRLSHGEDSSSDEDA